MIVLCDGGGEGRVLYLSGSLERLGARGSGVRSVECSIEYILEKCC